MFHQCRKLTSLDLSNFNTSKVKDMNNMFYQCKELNKLNIPNFDTSQVTNMKYMFHQCSKLIELNISNFKTSLVEDMHNMFYQCTSLTSVDLSNFDTSKAKDMNNMFYQCEKLNLLDLSSFNTLQVVDIHNMFYKSEKLEYINFKQFSINSDTNIDSLFEGTSENLVMCIQNGNDIFQTLFLSNKIIYCDDSNEIKYYCYMKNSALYNKYTCDICQNNFLFKNDEININNSYINCFIPKEIIYSSEVLHNFISCYNSCKLCEIEGNETYNNCIECKDDFTYEFNITNSVYKNCYKNNLFDYSTDVNKNIYTSELISTDNDYQQYSSELLGYTDISTNIQISNGNETIQSIINNMLGEFKDNKLDSGIIQRFLDENKIIILTTT